MPIIKTSDELRSLVPGLDKTLKFDSISSLINEVETDILTSVLGFELVDTLNTIYESGAAATPLQKAYFLFLKRR